MSKLIFFTIASLDGYVEDGRGKLDWAAPDDEVHSFINELVRPIGAVLYPRRMYKTMRAWGSMIPSDAETWGLSEPQLELLSHCIPHR